MKTLTTFPTARANIRSRPLIPLVRAEILKLRRRRGLITSVLVLTIGAVVTAYASLAAAHALDPSKYGPAGGMHQFQNALYVMFQLSCAAAILIGATSATGDIGSGVFRHLVATGRSRRALFAARIPGGLAVLLPPVAAAYAVGAVSSVAFADSRPAPHTLLLAETGAWMLLSVSITFLVALGVGSLFTERSTTLGVLIPLQLFVTPLIGGIAVLGRARDLLVGIDLWRFAPTGVRAASGPQAGLHLPAAVAVSILAVWCSLALIAGAWRTATREA
jgi:ABC-type transport system involved in multi-copper enzyme maturation permease subunit